MNYSYYSVGSFHISPKDKSKNYKEFDYEEYFSKLKMCLENMPGVSNFKYIKKSKISIDQIHNRLPLMLSDTNHFYPFLGLLYYQFDINISQETQKALFESSELNRESYNKLKTAGDNYRVIILYSGFLPVIYIKSLDIKDPDASQIHNIFTLVNLYMKNNLIHQDLEFSSPTYIFEYPVKIGPKELDNLEYEYLVEPTNTKLKLKNNIVSIYYNISKFGESESSEFEALRILSHYIGFYFIIRLSKNLLDSYDLKVEEKLNKLIVYERKHKVRNNTSKIIEDTNICIIGLQSSLINYTRNLKEYSSWLSTLPYNILFDIIDKKISEFEKLDYSMKEISELVNFYENRLTSYKAIFWGLVGGFIASLVIMAIELLLKLFSPILA